MERLARDNMEITANGGEKQPWELQKHTLESEPNFEQHMRLMELNPDSPIHAQKVQEQIAARREKYRVDKNKELHNENIQDLAIDDLPYEELDNMFFHNDAKNWGADKDKSGVKAKIGKNSEGIDEQGAIYFSDGVEGALNTWDVWLKWRLGRLYSPDMQGDIKIDSKEMADEYHALRDKWREEVVSGDYKDDREKLEALFEYQEAEFTGSDYYSLDLVEGEDFNRNTIDAKKARARGDPYEEIKYGGGIGTDFSHDRMEKWNMFTPLGKEKTIEPSRVKRLVLNNGANDTNSVLIALYDKYQKHCQETGEEPTQFDLLDKYVAWSKDRETEEAE